MYPLFSAGVAVIGEMRDYAECRMEKIEIGNVRKTKAVMVEAGEATNIDGSVRCEDVLKMALESFTCHVVALDMHI